ncbi:hypothetical protein [Rivularia sp. UHCC 0363]|uniref:hypothetical protein n=1 Tax=Rivularia sp. UHCC 0363 TaxID=3110244 RepID=UPI002B219051|nr:hypothetical protein [Rivularia sp. UHCC 0363]MEA5596046.1 hypothetical protein [Rivularia sp. UHCC 0363]
MKISKIVCSLAIATTLLTGISFKASANQPLGIVTRRSEVQPEGSAREIQGTFVLENVTEYPLILQIQPLETRSYNFKFSEEKLLLKPGQSAPVKFQGAITQDGKWQINVEIKQLSEEGVLAGRHTVDLYFLVKEGKYQVSTYEKLFLTPDVRDSQLGNSFESSMDDGSIPRAPQTIKRPRMEQLLEMDREAILKIPTETGGKEGRSTEPIRTIKPGLIRQPIIKPNPIFKPNSDTNRLKATTINAKGRFSWKGTDNQLHSAFGWRVRAWQKDGSSWKKVAEDWIQSNGSWQLQFPKSSGTVKFQYVAFNDFFTPQNSSGDTYRWVGPQRSSISTNHDEGGWFADTANGAVRGLGEIYDEGMNLWSKLYWNGGINPLRKKSIDVVFPNTTYDCGNGSGNPWSCANTGGKIWLIPSHATRNGVMQHELSHQINYEYWNNKLPPNSGGSHSLGSCYTPGLALTEGFANFMVFWTQAPRNSAPSAGFDFEVENPAFACKNPLGRNESWVASTFWDLHDTRADGKDNLWFNHEGAVPGIYLRTGKKDSMADFHEIYRNAANPEHRTIIDDIFRQNYIIP